MTIKSQERVLCCQHTRLKSPKTFSGGRTRAQAHHRAHLCIPNVAKNGQKTSATWQKSRLEDALLGILNKLVAVYVPTRGFGTAAPGQKIVSECLEPCSDGQNSSGPGAASVGPGATRRSVISAKYQSAQHQHRCMYQDV